jgi:hypothetical protein
LISFGMMSATGSKVISAETSLRRTVPNVVIRRHSHCDSPGFESNQNILSPPWVGPTGRTPRSRPRSNSVSNVPLDVTGAPQAGAASPRAVRSPKQALNALNRSKSSSPGASIGKARSRSGSNVVIVPEGEINLVRASSKSKIVQSLTGSPGRNLV